MDRRGQEGRKDPQRGKIPRERGSRSQSKGTQWWSRVVGCELTLLEGLTDLQEALAMVNDPTHPTPSLVEKDV